MGIFRKKTEISFFDKYRLILPSKFKWQQEPTPGKRVLFIHDPNETFIITFDEGMNPEDMKGNLRNNNSVVCYQYSKNGKSIELKRNTSGNMACARFNINIQRSDGSMACLPGQMVITGNYKWSDGIEPILVRLLENISVCYIEKRS